MQASWPKENQSIACIFSLYQTDIPLSHLQNWDIIRKNPSAAAEFPRWITAEAEPELSLLTPERFDFASVPGEAENRLSAAECEGGIRLIQRNCSAILHQFRHGVAPRSEKSVG